MQIPFNHRFPSICFFLLSFLCWNNLNCLFCRISQDLNFFFKFIYSFQEWKRYVERDVETERQERALTGSWGPSLSPASASLDYGHTRPSYSERSLHANKTLPCGSTPATCLTTKDLGSTECPPWWGFYVPWPYISRKYTSRVETGQIWVWLFWQVY